HLRDLHSFPTRRSSDLERHVRKWSAAAPRYARMRKGRSRSFPWPDSRGKMPPGGRAAVEQRSVRRDGRRGGARRRLRAPALTRRSEEHTSELQSPYDLV